MCNGFLESHFKYQSENYPEWLQKARNLKILPILFILTFFELIIQGQEKDYRKLFGGHWDAAEEFIAANERWMRSECEIHNITYSFAIAIVFPELVRYSALRDKIEISILKTLYINLGDEYADFSVGPFQMKPSFAEKVTEGINVTDDRKLRRHFSNKILFRDLRDYRTSIVRSLEDEKAEFYYLIAFIKLCDLRFPEFIENTGEKLEFYSTAYNCGLDKSFDYIKTMTGKKFFSTSLFKGETYSYSEISRYWYNSHQNL
jgi:hypothetical protein